MCFDVALCLHPVFLPRGLCVKRNPPHTADWLTRLCQERERYNEKLSRARLTTLLSLLLNPRAGRPRPGLGVSGFTSALAAPRAAWKSGFH